MKKSHDFLAIVIKIAFCQQIPWTLQRTHAHMNLMAAWHSTTPKMYLAYGCVSSTSQAARSAVVFLVSLYSQLGKICWKRYKLADRPHSATHQVLVVWTPRSWSVHLSSPEAPLAFDWHRLGGVSLTDASQVSHREAGESGNRAGCLSQYNSH